MKRKILITFLTVALSASTVSALPFGIDLHGCEVATKSHSLWQLTRLKYTTLLRTEPMCWTPFKSYLLIDRYVKVYDRYDRNWVAIEIDLVNAVYEDAEYNRTHAHRYKGKPKTRLKKIYRYCRRTEYVPHVKTARSVLENRQGDCAGIASAFYVLCRKNKIPCKYVIGWTDTGCHAFNRVKIGKKWYWCDATLGHFMKRKLPEGWSVMEIW